LDITYKLYFELLTFVSGHTAKTTNFILELSVPRHICTVHNMQLNTRTAIHKVTACYEQSHREPSKELNEGGDLRESSSRHSSVCFVIPALIPVTDCLNCHWECAYANDFPSQLRTATWAN